MKEQLLHSFGHQPIITIIVLIAIVEMFNKRYWTFKLRIPYPEPTEMGKEGGIFP